MSLAGLKFRLSASHSDKKRDAAKPMYDFLCAKGLEAEYHCYGTEEASHVGHVFHVNIALPEAQQCNRDAVAFFKKHL
ncbi:MAG: hypothetical protein ACI3V0_07980 [Faecousia sp.]